MGKVKMIDKLEIRPQGEYILVKVDQVQEEKTSGGIIVPSMALQNKKTQTGVVIEVGQGRRDPQNIDRRVPVDCAPGDRILFACLIGYPIMIKDEEYVLIKYNDIMAFVKEESRMVDDLEGVVVTDDKKKVL